TAPTARQCRPQHRIDRDSSGHSRSTPSPIGWQGRATGPMSYPATDDLGVVLPELRRQLGKRRTRAVEGEREPDQRQRAGPGPRLDDPERGGLRIGYHLVDGLDRPVRDPGGVEPRRPDGDRFGREQVGKDWDQGLAIDDPVAIRAEPWVSGE